MYCFRALVCVPSSALSLDVPSLFLAPLACTHHASMSVNAFTPASLSLAHTLLFVIPSTFSFSLLHSFSFSSSSSRARFPCKRATTKSTTTTVIAVCLVDQAAERADRAEQRRSGREQTVLTSCFLKKRGEERAQRELERKRRLQSASLASSSVDLL